MSGVSIVPIFATPFAVTELPEAERLNSSVAEFLKNFACTDDAPSPTSTPNCYRSRENIRLDSPQLQAVLDEALSGMVAVAAAVSGLSDEQMRQLSAQTSVSFSIVRSNGSLPVHNYPLTSWCGIYCVEAPAPSTDRRDSGVLRLYESRLRGMFSDATNSAMQVPYATGHYAWRPVPGQMAVFPGATSHGIALIRSTGNLVLLTLRLRFVASGQTGWGRW